LIIPIKLPKEDKDEIIKSVQAYFIEERSETIGELGAEQFIEFMISELGPYIYNKGISDSRYLINEKFNQIEDELYTLQRPIQNQKR
jgi:uncharacterized protein (DUF2164 family)